MSEVNINPQGDANIGGDVVGGDKITNITYEAALPAALSLHQLPAPPRDFTGREAELEQLRAALKTGGVTIGGLHGLGGVGKTALALKLANELLADYPDAQFYIDLRGAAEQEPLTPAQAQAHIIRAYYPQNKLPEDDAQLNALYQSVLNGQRALLVLDNAGSAAQVAPLLPPRGSLTLLTSRQNFAVPGLRAFALDTLKPEEAEALIFRIAERLGSGDEGVKGSVQKIAALCGYLPLAVRAATSLLAETVDLDPAKYAKDLESETARLGLTALKAEAVPISVHASLNLSYQRLPAEAQVTVRGLSVFPDDFDAPAAEYVCEDEGHQHLSLLLRWSLAEYVPPSPSGRPPEGGKVAGGEGRYKLHDLTRAFARALCTDEERAVFSLRHAEHYKNVLSEADDLYLQGGENITRGLALFDLERVNIEAGQEWASAPALRGYAANVTAGTREGLEKAGVQLCNLYPDAGAYVLSLRQHPRQKIAWLEAALTAARRLKNRSMEGMHLGNLGLAHAALGDARKAIEFYEQALVIDREIGDIRGEGTDLWNMALALDSLGERAQAIPLAEAALKIREAIKDPKAEKVRRKLAKWRGEGDNQ